MKEQWKIYRDTSRYYQGHLYEISNLGNVKLDGELAKTYIHTNGYEHICHFPIHRMVAEMFIPNTENKPCVDHIDGNRLNNRVDNLRWVTWKENNNNSITKERRSISATGKIYSDETNSKKGRKGEEHPFYGKHHKQETKDTMSEKMKGNKNALGTHRTQETRGLQSKRRIEFEAKQRENGLKRKRIYVEGKAKYIYVNKCQIS